MRNEPQIYVQTSPAEIARTAAEAFVQLAQGAAAADRDLMVALSGGSTPKLLYDLLASDEFSDSVAWPSIRFFFGDERWVPHTDSQSNFKLANDHLFKPLGISHTHVYPMPTSGEPEEAAARYEMTLRAAFGVKEDVVPQFDLVFLGMGDEGHTASLFPNTDVLRENARLVAATYVPKLDANRITLTPVMLNAAAATIVMVGGGGKAAALREVLAGEYNPDEYPAQLLRNSVGHVIWLVDQDAAAQIDDAIM